MVNQTVKSTINLDSYCKEQLEHLVKLNVISSLTEGINCAIMEYLKRIEKEQYAAQMRKAKEDKAFMKRTLDSQRDFERSDAEINDLSEEEEW